MPAIKFDTKEAIPEGLREFATEGEDGTFTVKVAPEAKLSEFRDKNVALSQQIETLTPMMARVKEIAGDDLDAFANQFEELKGIAQRVNDGELKTSEDIEKAVAERVNAVKEGYEQNQKSERDLRTKAERERDEFRQTLDRTEIRHAITAAVIAPNSGVRPEALGDILERAYKLFRWENGKPIPKNGESTIFGADGAEPMTPSEWIVKLRDEAPYFFAGNGGGGANGGTTTKHGLTSAEIAKLTPEQKLALANGG
ncbi:capsid assembly scaffolding [Citromicrobium phage vB_CbaS-RXM]|nr:capsid assembly scaffolding [Citromicrobium phage vB_CbaS-RXM]